MPKTSITIIGLLTLVIIGLAYLVQQQPVDLGRVVFRACEKARINNSVPESRCAQLQDQYKYEYLCRDRNNSTETECWVESNDKLGEL